MPTAKKEAKVNLMPQKEFEKSTLGRILRWALSSFRMIVIFTEMIVMGAFLSRFWLDAKNSDLNATITQKKAIIMSFADVEEKFRDAQKKVRVIAKLTPENTISSYVKSITSFLPTDVKLNSITESETGIQIAGASGNEESIAQLMVNLESVKSFKEVSLIQIDSSKENPLITLFTITVNL